jgi:hypothetical protein
MSQNQPEHCRLLVKLVEEEGPIHFKYAVKRLAGAWGLKRTGIRVNKAVREAVRSCTRRRLMRVKDSFLWPIHHKDPQIRLPVPGVQESKRKLEHIPPEEIEQAMIKIINLAVGLSVESLISETARVFGFNRTGVQIKDSLLKVYNGLLKKKKLANKNNTITLYKAHS